MESHSNLHAISLPCLRGHMGDWWYYVTLLSFKELSNRVKMPEEIDGYQQNEKLKLGDWIQRDLESGRLSHIVHYLRSQKQHFFNSLILGIYEGNPTWQDINISENKMYENIDNSRLEYISRTFGILTLEGTEDIFAIDGQHRAMAVRQAIKENEELETDEIAVIFVAHSANDEGKIRTRRLFSTLNKYAKPVSQSEIIALSEDNNCAIITRNLVDNYKLFSGKILVIKNRSINPENKTDFTSIMVLYDIVERLLTNKAVCGIKVSGYDKNDFTKNRASDDELNVATKKVRQNMEKVISSIPVLNDFFMSHKPINRKNKASSLLFRPIGQNIFFDVLKVGIELKKTKKVLTFFANNTFNLQNKVWKRVFWDTATESMQTEKSRQRYATLLILEHLGFDITRTAKDSEIYDSFDYSPEDI